jgi:hypothetical protein
MTLDEMANFICGKVNQTEAEDVLACKGFLKRRHEMIWAEGLWKDSLVEYRQTLSPTGYTLQSTWLPTKGVLLLPSIIQRVLGVRNDTRKLNVQRPEYFYRIDYDAFAKTGDATDYILLPPCAWELDTSEHWFLHRLDAADADLKVYADTLEADGVSVDRVLTTLAKEFNVLGQGSRFASFTDRIDRVAKITSSGSVLLKPSYKTGSTVDITNDSASVLQIGIAPSDDIGAITGTTTIQPGATRSVIGIDYYLFVWDNVSAYITPATGFNGAGTSFQGIVTWDGAAFTFDSDEPSITLQAEDTLASLRQRIRLIEIPTAETVVRVLGKRFAPTFTDDMDEPGISGSENCLIGFAQGDMLQRERQYGKAKEQFEEGMLLLDQLKRVETVQQAHNARIIPEGGFGDTGFGHDTKSSFF